jgi:hypothetical protein
VDNRYLRFAFGIHKWNKWENLFQTSPSASPWRGGEAYSINEWKPRIHNAPLTHEPGRAVALGRVLVLTWPNFNDLFIRENLFQNHLFRLLKKCSKEIPRNGSRILSFRHRQYSSSEVVSSRKWTITAMASNFFFLHFRPEPFLWRQSLRLLRKSTKGSVPKRTNSRSQRQREFKEDEAEYANIKGTTLASGKTIRLLLLVYSQILQSFFYFLTSFSCLH